MSFAAEGCSVLLVAFVAALFVLPRLSRIAERIGLVDHPNGRKVHKTPVALVGGIGMAMALSLAGLMFIPLVNLRGFYAGALIVVMVGFLDDFKELAPRTRFVAQIAAGLCMVYFSSIRLLTFGDLLGVGSLDVGRILSVPVTIFCVVGVVNSINMMDGLDGLAGGVSLVALAAFSVLSFNDGHLELMLLSLALCGAVLGFLRYNWFPAKLFMGDAGSMLLGFALSFLAVAVTQKSASMVRPVDALLIVAVPIADTLVVMTLRVLRGRSPFRPDNHHFHHLLLRYVPNRKTVVKIMLVVAVSFAAVGVAGTLLKIPEPVLFGFFVVYLAGGMVFSYRSSQRFCILDDDTGTGRVPTGEVLER